MDNNDDKMFLLEAMLFGGSDAIQRQEKRGQESLVKHDVLPRECPRDECEALGIVFGEDVDDLFVSVTLPEGWTKKGTSHDMWSHLLDNHGYKRGAIFYKAAFYDRVAHMSLNNRYIGTSEPLHGYGDDYVQGETTYISKAIDTATDTVIWQSEPYERVRSDSVSWDDLEKLGNQSRVWLDENYPEWKSVLAYWDNE